MTPSCVGSALATMKNTLALTLIAAIGLGTAARGQAPEPYVGYGIAPVDAPTIHMVSAKVDIFWGYPGTLCAVFVMDNETNEATDVQVGFPVSLPKRFCHQDSLDFTMTFNGVPVERADIRRVTPERQSLYDDPAVWFHCRHRFPPGPTTVKVETRLPTNPRADPARADRELSTCGCRPGTTNESTPRRRYSGLY